MPAVKQLVSEPPATAYDAVGEQLGLALRTYQARVNRVRIVRRKSGLSRARGGLAQEVVTTFGPNEDAEAVIASCVEQVLEIIADAAGNDAWLGEVVLLDESLPSGKQELTSVPVRIEDGGALPVSTRDETGRVIRELRLFTADMATQVVRIVGAAASREESIAKLVGSVAEWRSRSDGDAAKYEFLRETVKAEVEMHEVDQEARLRRSDKTKQMFVDIVGRYNLQGLIDLFVRTMSDKPPPSAEGTTTTTTTPPRGAPTLDDYRRIVNNVDPAHLEAVARLLPLIEQVVDASLPLAQRSTAQAQLVAMLSQLPESQRNALADAGVAVHGRDRANFLLRYLMQSPS